MTFVVSSPPASEPLTVAEVKSFCRIDGTNAEPAPGAMLAPALVAPPAAGNVDNGSHRYLVTFVTVNGETEAGAQSAAVVVADKTVNGKVQLTGVPLGGTAVIARKIYRTIAAGAAFLLLVTIADNTTTTYLDNTADAGLGAGAPAVNTTDDGLLALLVTSARQNAEQQLNRYLVTQTVDRYLDEFPWCSSDVYDREAYEIRLPPLQAVTGITYVDLDGNTQTLDPAQYIVDANAKPARVGPAYGLFWPPARHQRASIRVRFTAGYGAAAAVPACVKQWMLLAIKTSWDNRDGLVVGERGQVLMPTYSYVDALLEPEQVQMV